MNNETAKYVTANSAQVLTAAQKRAAQDGGRCNCGGYPMKKFKHKPAGEMHVGDLVVIDKFGNTARITGIKPAVDPTQVIVITPVSWEIRQQTDLLLVEDQQTLPAQLEQKALSVADDLKRYEHFNDLGEHLSPSSVRYLNQRLDDVKRALNELYNALSEIQLQHEENQ